MLHNSSCRRERSLDLWFHHVSYTAFLKALIVVIGDGICMCNQTRVTGKSKRNLAAQERERSRTYRGGVGSISIMDDSDNEKEECWLSSFEGGEWID